MTSDLSVCILLLFRPQLSRSTPSSVRLLPCRWSSARRDEATTLVRMSQDFIVSRHSAKLQTMWRCWSYDST